MNISIYLITCLHEFAITMKINVAYNDVQFFGGYMLFLVNHYKLSYYFFKLFFKHE